MIVLEAMGITALVLGVLFVMVWGLTELQWWVHERWGWNASLWLALAIGFLLLFPLVLLGALGGWQ